MTEVIAEEDLRKEFDERVQFLVDNSWMQSMDAEVWAKKFIEYKKRNRWTHSDIDESLMIGWFANAIMAGYDEATRRAAYARQNPGEE